MLQCFFLHRVFLLGGHWQWATFSAGPSHQRADWLPLAIWPASTCSSTCFWRWDHGYFSKKKPKKLPRRQNRDSQSRASPNPVQGTLANPDGERRGRWRRRRRPDARRCGDGSRRRSFLPQPPAASGRHGDGSRRRESARRRNGMRRREVGAAARREWMARRRCGSTRAAASGVRTAHGWGTGAGRQTASSEEALATAWRRTMAPSADSDV
jgi:hypothetical protein